MLGTMFTTQPCTKARRNGVEPEKVLPDCPMNLRTIPIMYGTIDE